MEKDDLLEFCGSEQYEKLSTREKEKCALAYYDKNVKGGVKKMEDSSQKWKNSKMIASLPLDVFIEKIVVDGGIRGKDLISLCSSDPAFKSKCDAKNGALYRKLLNKEFKITPSQMEKLTISDLKRDYSKLSERRIWRKNEIGDEWKEMPNIGDVKDFYYNNSRFIVILTMDGYLYRADLYGNTFNLNLGGFDKIFPYRSNSWMYFASNGNKLYMVLELESTKAEIIATVEVKGSEIADVEISNKGQQGSIGREIYIINNKGSVYMTEITNDEKGQIIVPQLKEITFGAPIKKLISASNFIYALGVNGNLHIRDLLLVLEDRIYPSEKKIIDIQKTDVYSNNERDYMDVMVLMFDDGEIKIVGLDDTYSYNYSINIPEAHKFTNITDQQSFVVEREDGICFEVSIFMDNKSHNEAEILHMRFPKRLASVRGVGFFYLK